MTLENLGSRIPALWSQTEGVDANTSLGVTDTCSCSLPAPEFVVVDFTEFFSVGDSCFVPEELNEVKSRLKTIFERHIDAE